MSFVENQYSSAPSGKGDQGLTGNRLQIKQNTCCLSKVIPLPQFRLLNAPSILVVARQCFFTAETSYPIIGGPKKADTDLIGRFKMKNNNNHFKVFYL